MDKLMQVFEYNGAQVRVVESNGKPWFVARDIADVLEMTWNGSTTIAHVPAGWQGVLPVNTPSGTQQMLVLSEQGLYFFLNRSDKPKAIPFQMWVNGDVLPSIRQTGFYSLDRLPTHLETAKALVAALEKIEADKPKVEFAERVRNADGLQNMNQTAKALGWGEIKLFAHLRNRGILMTNNMPLQKYIDRGYFQVIENVISMGDGDVIKPQTMVTPKGLIWLQKVVPPYEGHKKSHLSGKTRIEGHWKYALAGNRQEIGNA